MNREIKFRFWDSINKKMLGLEEVIELCEDTEEIKALFKGQLSDGIDIMQYTGLKDKNGKEIYEGDIVKTYDGTRWFKDEITINEFHGMMIGMHSATDVDYFNCKIEIIGNKFENKELLK